MSLILARLCLIGLSCSRPACTLPAALPCTILRHSLFQTIARTPTSMRTRSSVRLCDE
ncbi:hypothetical protein RSAG8_03903, partial [Rhizoctonia solani AG-8 WAC10335]